MSEREEDQGTQPKGRENLLACAPTRRSRGTVFRLLALVTIRCSSHSDLHDVVANYAGVMRIESALERQLVEILVNYTWVEAVQARKLAGELGDSERITAREGPTALIDLLPEGLGNRLWELGAVDEIAQVFGEGRIAQQRRRVAVTCNDLVPG